LYIIAKLILSKNTNGTTVDSIVSNKTIKVSIPAIITYNGISPSAQSLVSFMIPLIPLKNPCTPTISLICCTVFCVVSVAVPSLSITIIIVDLSPL